MEPSPYTRDCPRCSTSFTAVSERGVCPSCKLFFRRNRDGALVGIVLAFESPTAFDWPFEPVDYLCAATFEAFLFGGSPIFVSDRHDDYPSVELVHHQLVEIFHKIKDSIKSHLPDTARYGYDVDTLPTCYNNATSCDLVAWDQGGKHYQLVCYLSPDGGSIDAILDRKAEWHAIG